MKIGLVLPSILMAKRFGNRIFAPKELFLWLADGLVDRKHEVFVYSTSTTPTKAKVISENEKLEIKDYISIKDIRKSQNVQTALIFNRVQYEYEIALISKAINDANEKNIDILHIYLDSISHYFSRFSKIPVVFTIHDPVFDENILENFRLKMFPNQNYIMISKYQEKSYHTKLNFTQTSVIYHGLKLDNFSFSNRTDNYLGLIGRFIPEKGIEDAIQVALKLKFLLKIASSNNYLETDYYLENIKPYLNSPYVEELRFLQFGAKAQFLGLSKVFLFPIHWEEPFGLVMIESMACGTPVIAYARGSVPEIIKDGETGFIINQSPDDIRGDWIVKKTGIDGLREAVERIYAMPDEEYKQMRKNCRAHVEKNFTAERMVDEYEKLYEKIIENKAT